MRKICTKLIKKVRKTFFPTEHQRELARWRKDDVQNLKRYNYDLNSKSLVFDLGGFRGEWASKIYDLYKCEILIFEPVKSFHSNITKKFESEKSIQVFPYGLSSKDEIRQMSVCGDSSSIFIESEDALDIKLVDIKRFIEEHKIKHIDLIKINIEGGEYELLERLIEVGFLTKIDNLQIQFHLINDSSESRMKKIQRSLAKTHGTTYKYKFVWENWERIK